MSHWHLALLSFQEGSCFGAPSHLNYNPIYASRSTPRMFVVFHLTQILLVEGFQELPSTSQVARITVVSHCTQPRASFMCNF
jgi:hypothetical protein